VARSSPRRPARPLRRAGACGRACARRKPRQAGLILQAFPSSLGRTTRFPRPEIFHQPQQHRATRSGVGEAPSPRTKTVVQREFPLGEDPPNPQWLLRANSSQAAGSRMPFSRPKGNEETRSERQLPDRPTCDI